MNNPLKYILSRLDNTTAWIGVIGLVLLVFNLHTLLVALFVALFFIPEGNFSDMFKKLTKEIRDLDDAN